MKSKFIFFSEILILSLIMSSCDDFSKTEKSRDKKELMISKEMKEAKKVRTEYFLQDKREKVEKIKKVVNELNTNIALLKKHFTSEKKTYYLEQTIKLELRKEKLKQLLFSVENISEKDWDTLKYEIDTILNEQESTALNNNK